MCSLSCFLYRYYTAKSRIIRDHEAVFEHSLPFDWFLYDRISVMKELSASSCSSTIRPWNATLKILKMSIVLEYWNYFDAVTVINYVMILVTLVNRSRFKCFHIIYKKKSFCMSHTCVKWIFPAGNYMFKLTKGTLEQVVKYIQS